MLEKIKKTVSRTKKYLAMLISTSILCCGWWNSALAMDLSKISQVYFFGDSLTDSGFNDGLTPFLPPGKAPTFTTFGGFTWSQFIAHDIKGFPFPVYPGPSVPDLITNNSIEVHPPEVTGTLTGVDYAAAGSTTNSTGFIETYAPSLHQQIAFYLSSIPQGQRLDPHAVFFIWSGANDFLVALSTSPFPTELQLLMVAQTAAQNIANEVAELAARGARRVVVISLPDFGLSPFANSLPVPGAPATLKTLSFTFNSMLNTQLAHVITRFGIKILYVDVYELLNKVVNATKLGQPFVVGGQSFLFVNYTTPACGTGVSAILCPSTAPNNFIFADSVHPTGMTHHVIALEVEELMKHWR